MRAEQAGGSRPSVGRLAAPLVEALADEAQALRLAVRRTVAGARLIDAGIDAPGGIEAGRRIAEICMGGLGWVQLADSGPGGWPFRVTVRSAEPVLACLGSQYAGWKLAHDSYHAMASGPGRARAAQEHLFGELGYHDEAPTAAFVIETDQPPPDDLVEQMAADCRLQPQDLTLILTPTSSLAGVVQIAARVLEVALHKTHALGFPLEHVRDGLGTAPLPPPSPDFLTAMGRTNDAILFGGEVQLFVTGPDDAAEDLANRLPSSSSRDYGRPFKEVFEAAKFDFYAVDSMLFSPARVLVTALDSGRSFRGGRLAPELLARSFGDPA